VERLSALELLARLSLHVPQPYQPLRFYYGAYSNHARHRRAALSESERRCEQQEGQAGISRKAWRRRWAYLIHKIYGEDSLQCAHCGGAMKVLGLITEPKTIDTILAFLSKYHPERLPGADQDLTLTYPSRAGPLPLQSP
jgi:hypothetical protein